LKTQLQLKIINGKEKKQVRMNEKTK